MRNRASGVLLHPTSLAGPPHVGDLGPAAHQFVDWLGSAGQSVWQMLPLGPTGVGDSPYGASSAFAGNPLLISPEALELEDLLPAGGSVDLELPPGNASHVDIPAVAIAKDRLLRRSWEHVRGRSELEAELEAFAQDPAERAWLADWSLYAALKRENGQLPWWEWPESEQRDGGALRGARERLGEEIRFQTYVQFLFSRQWRALRRHTRERGILLLGDMPIYVAADSADVWANQPLFELGADGRPSAVAGVPPDAFSEDGQFWGNPLYRWDEAREACFAWWVSRLRSAFRTFDRVRLDHFRGFAGYWRIPAAATTAREGEWVEGPGAELFETAERELGQLPLIAEDLGVITPDVVALRQRLGLPGMKVLQFGFDEIDSDHLPHHHTADAVVYTGTHDNDTTRGWFEELAEETRQRVLDYFGAGRDDVHWTLVRAALRSPAHLAILPAQDLLGLGSEARMNTPGRGHGNWAWRLESGRLDAELAAKLRRLTRLTGRLSEPAGS